MARQLSKAQRASAASKLTGVQRNTDGQIIPNSVFGTDISRTEYVNSAQGDVQMMHVGFTDRSGRPMPFGNDSHDFVQALESSLDETFNNGEFREVMQDSVFPCEFRPYGTEPTPIRRQTLQDRSVRFQYNKLANRLVDAPAATAITGSAVVVTPVLNPESAKSGILCSAATHVSDFDMMAGWTEGSLYQTVSDMQSQFCRIMFGKVAEVLAATPDLQVIKAPALSGKPRDIAEDILDTLSLNLPVELGATLDDYALLVPEKLEPVLERAAQRAGHADIDELLGCSVWAYSGKDSGVYLLPKRFAMVSFRSTRSGDTVEVKVTRNSNAAGYDVELISVIDMMATGTVKVKNGSFEPEMAYSFPLVHAIRFADAAGESA